MIQTRNDFDDLDEREWEREKEEIRMKLTREISDLKQEIDSSINKNHLTDNSVREEASLLNSHILFFIIFPLVLYFTITYLLYIQNKIPEDSIKPVCIILIITSGIISYIFYKAYEKICESHFRKHEQELILKTIHFEKIKEKKRRSRTGKINKEYYVIGKNEKGRKIKTMIEKSEYDSYIKHPAEKIYVLEIPKFPFGHHNRIYHSYNFQNNCKEIYITKK